MAWLDRRTEDMLRRLSAFDGLKIRDDPEAIFQEGRFFCDVGEHRRGLDYCSGRWRKAISSCPTLDAKPRVRRAAR